jgi:tRNA pseudouridine38-40 synthase
MHTINGFCSYNALRNIKIICQYDGTEFSGFQRQADARTIQGCLEEALETIVKQPVRVCGAGRTDAGVHAQGQVANFHISVGIPTQALLRAMNSLLPEDVRVYSAEEVDADFHARYWAKAKTYEYRIWNHPIADVFTQRYAYHVVDNLDLCNMKRCAEALVGTHDFAAFQAAGSIRASTVRSLKRLECERDGDLVSIRATADGFLYKMVRNLAGCLVQAGRNKISVDEVSSLLKSGDRRQAPPTAPAKGLVLAKVEY